MTPADDSRASRSALRATFACFAVSTAAAIGLAVVYGAGGQPQLEGVLLGLALLGLGAGLIVFAHHFFAQGPFAEARHPLASTAEEREELEQSFDRAELVTRRRLLAAGLASSVGALTVAFLFPVRSLGPRPGHALERTPWRSGTFAITNDQRRVLARNVPLEGLVTVFPEGHPDSADGQVVLIRVHPHRLDLPPDRKDWAPEGLVAYSKVCTHAGCPVGLYQAGSGQLLCPCHQSAFDALTGAQPVFGPAARALPQLPIAIDDDGYIVAQSDFHEPVGPSYWSRP